MEYVSLESSSNQPHDEDFGYVDYVNMPELSTVDEIIAYFDQEEAKRKYILSTTMASADDFKQVTASPSGDIDLSVPDIHIKNDDLCEHVVIDLTYESEGEEDKNNTTRDAEDDSLSANNKAAYDHVVIDLTNDSEDDEDGSLPTNHKDLVSIISKARQQNSQQTTRSTKHSVSRPLRNGVIRKRPQARKRKRKSRINLDTNDQDIRVNIKTERIEYTGFTYDWDHPRRRGDEDGARHWVGRFLSGEPNRIDTEILTRSVESVTADVRVKSEWSPTQITWDEHMGLFRGEVYEGRWLHVQRDVMMDMLNDVKGEHFGRLATIAN